MLETKCGWCLLAKRWKMRGLKHPSPWRLSTKGPGRTLIPTRLSLSKKRGGGCPSRITLGRRSPSRPSWTLPARHVAVKATLQRIVACNQVGLSTLWYPIRKRRRKRQNQQSLKSVNPREILPEKERSKRNIETGSHLTLTAQTLRTIPVRGRGTCQDSKAPEKKKKKTKQHKEWEWGRKSG